jgi:hypothetical protein
MPIQWNLWIATLQNEDILWNKDTSPGPKLLFSMQIDPWNEDTSELGTPLARPKGVLISQVSLYFVFHYIRSLLHSLFIWWMSALCNCSFVVVNETKCMLFIHLFLKCLEIFCLFLNFVLSKLAVLYMDGNFTVFCGPTVFVSLCPINTD